MVKPILEHESGLKAGLPDGFGLCFSYERVMVGRLIHNIREYPKIVGGIDDQSTRTAIQMYQSIVKGGVYGTNPMTAEVSKTVENAYRDVQIAFANEVALVCESLGIDVYDGRKFVNGLPTILRAACQSGEKYALPGGWSRWALFTQRYMAVNARLQSIWSIPEWLSFFDSQRCSGIK
jgi:UDP-N-acetyl-D-mannosaminuronate dehydrogenase